MATISNERHLRYILLLGEGGTLVLKEILDRERHRSGKTLDALLEPNKASLKRKLDKQIFQKVFPANGSPDASTWDISLLATIILQLFRKSLTGDECNAIRNLKDLRNDLAHASSLSMDANEYDDDRKELAAALMKLSGGLDRTVHDKCQTFIKEFATGPIDAHAATERIKEFSKYDEMIRAELGSLTGKVEAVSGKVESMSHELQGSIMATAERRIILLGNTGTGKSSTGNSLLGRHEFAEFRSRPVTQGCQFRKRMNDKRQMAYTIVDTPGLMCTDGNLAENLLEIQRSAEICPKPHAFLLVFSPFSRLNEDEDCFFDLLRVAFGEQVFNHCIVVFTHGKYFSTDEEFTQYWQRSNMLLKLVDRCGGRISRMENKNSTVLSHDDDVNRIYDKVETMSDSGKHIYCCQTIEMHKHALQDCMVRNKGSRYIRMQQISTLVHALGFKEMKETTERRIILIGKTGNGKSSTGNSLLGQLAFKQEKSPMAVTQSCLLRKRYCYKRNLIYAVVDTPGLLNPEASLAEQLLKIQNALEYCPDPHVFLLVFSSADRMTQDEVYSIDMLRVTFGEKVFDNSIVVYTRGSEFSTDEEFTKYWQESGLLVEYVKRCGGRITRIENKDLLDIDCNVNVNRIFYLIEHMSDSGRKTYQYKHVKTHKEVLMNHIENYKGKTDIQDQLSALAQKLKERLRSSIWNPLLVGGTIASVGIIVLKLVLR